VTRPSGKARFVKFASAISTQSDPEEAAREVVQRVRVDLDEPEVGLALVFLSAHYARQAHDVAEKIRRDLSPQRLLGCTGIGVIGGGHEIESEPAVTLLAGHLPDVVATPFHLDADSVEEVIEDETDFRKAVGGEENPAAVILLADPISLPVDRVLDAFNRYLPGVPVVGGMASVASPMGGNTLLLDAESPPGGAVGVALSGNLTVDVIVSQGCRPIGHTCRVTRSDRNVIYELDGKPAVKTLRRLIDSLSDKDRALLRLGVLVGTAIDPSKEQHGRGDFLVRNVVGFNADLGAIVAADLVEEDSVVQFHVRDADTASEDLEMMLLPQSLLATPAGGLVFSCNGRGTTLYGEPDGDIRAIQESLGGDLPCAGFFCAGELGPIGGVNFIHGHTASLALFRPKVSRATEPSR
jgi:small ligand-binding sensory domain FIST